MKRKMEFLEASMYAGPDTPVNVVFPVTVEGRLNENAIRTVLHKIQRKHPFLRVIIETGIDGIPWYVTPPAIAPIPVRIVPRSSEEVWIVEADTEWKNPFSAPYAPLARLVWVRAHEVSELLIVCHHCIADATSIITLMRELLECLADPGKELEPYLPFVPEALVGTAIRESLVNRLAARTLATITKIFLLTVSGMNVVRKDRFYTIRWKLDAFQTSALLSICKDQDINLNAALTLVFMRAFGHARNVPTTGKMYTSVDMRRFIPGIDRDHLFAFPSMVGLSTPADTESFRDQANSLRDKLYRHIKKTNAQKILFFTKHLLPLYPQSIRYAKAGKGDHDFAFANLGRIPLNDHYGDLRVTDVYSPFSRFPMGNPSKVSVSTFGGRMDFAFTSEEGYLSYDDAISITRQAMLLLQRHLPIPEPLISPDLK